MPGIWGLVNGSGSSDDLTTLFRAMGDRLKHHAFYREDLHLGDDRGPCLGRMSLGFVNAAPQPASNEDGSLIAVMEGEIFDPEGHRRGLRAAGHDVRGESQAELLLHGYARSGREFFRGLNGSFAAAIWDGRRRQLVLVNDRFGMKPLYYARSANRFVFASEIKALLADPSVSRSLAPRGVAQFFAFGHLLGEDTFFEAVRLMPAASWLTFEADAGRTTLDRYWRIGAGQGGPRLSGLRALDQIDEAFGDAVDRCTAGANRLGISLSGGLDSRTILAAIDTDRTPVTAVSLGLDGSIDVESAGEMARLTRSPHRRYQLDGSFLSDFEDYLRWMVHLTDGHYLSQCIVMPTLPIYRELGIEVLLRGHAGELMHMDKAYSYSLDRDALGIRDGAGLEAWLLRRLRTSMTEGIEGPLFTPDFRGMMEVLPRESLRECLAASEQIDPPVHRIWHLFLDQRVRRETAMSMVEFGSLVETRLPFLDNGLIDLLFRTDPGLKIGEAIQAHIIRRRRPAFLGIANANTGVRVGAGRLARVLGKARLRVMAKLGVRGYQPYERLGLWLREDLYPVVKRLLLSDRCLSRGIFEPRAIESVVRQHGNNKRNHTSLLMALMIFEQGHREFIDGDGPPDRPVAVPGLEPAGSGVGH